MQREPERGEIFPWNRQHVLWWIRPPAVSRCPRTHTAWRQGFIRLSDFMQRSKCSNIKSSAASRLKSSSMTCSMKLTDLVLIPFAVALLPSSKILKGSSPFRFWLYLKRVPRTCNQPLERSVLLCRSCIPEWLYRSHRWRLSRPDRRYVCIGSSKRVSSQPRVCSSSVRMVPIP